MAPQPLIESKSGPRVRVAYGGDAPRHPAQYKSGGHAEGMGTEDGRTSVRHRNMPNNGEDMASPRHASVRGRRVATAVNSNMHQQGMGMGMGYGGGYGMMPMGGMGYGYGMGYGGMGMGGPMSMIYSVNYFIATIGQFAAMLGMSTHAVGHLLHMAKESLLKVEKTIRQSEIRRWLQRKSDKSPLFRWALVIVSMLAASQIVRLARYLIEVQLRRTGGALLIGSGPGSVGSANGSAGTVGASQPATSLLESPVGL